MPPAKRQYSNKHEFKGRLQKIKQSLKFQQKAKQTFQKGRIAFTFFTTLTKSLHGRKDAAEPFCLKCRDVQNKTPRHFNRNMRGFD